MNELDRPAAAFQAMNPWAQRLLRELSERYAVDFPVPKPKPHLRLVTEERKVKRN